jgi:tetratricopeptide (TPR) repeat protein
MYALRKRRWPTAVLLCFILPLVPVLAFFQNGIQAFASRFTYLPSLAPSLALAFIAGGSCLAHGVPGQKRFRQVGLGVVGAMVLAYAVVSWQFSGFWKNTETVWTRIIDTQPTGRAYKERGLYYLSVGMDRRAEADLSASLLYAERAGFDEIYKLYAFRGLALYNQQRMDEAVMDFNRALHRCPDPRYFYLRGSAQQELGNSLEAEADFSRAGSADGQIEWGNSDCR